MNDEERLMAKIIGEYIASLRWEKRIKQYRLAQKTGIPLCSLRVIEKGEVDVSARLLSKIVNELGEDMGEFWKKVEKNMKVMR